MTGDQWDFVVSRVRLWWSMGTSAWAKDELWLEFDHLDEAVVLEAVYGFRDEGYERAPSPSAVYRRAKDLSPPDPVIPIPDSFDCPHDQHVYPWAWYPHEKLPDTIIRECRYCGLTEQVPRAWVTTPGQDRERRTA